MLVASYGHVTQTKPTPLRMESYWALIKNLFLQIYHIFHPDHLFHSAGSYDLTSRGFLQHMS